MSRTERRRARGRRSFISALSKDIVRPVAKVAITSALYWLGSKAYRRITGRRSTCDGVEHGGSEILNVVKNRAVETITDTIITQLLAEKKDSKISGDVELFINSHIGTFEYCCAGGDFPPWRKNIVRVMLWRFLHDPSSGAVVEDTTGPEGKGDCIMIPVETGHGSTEVVWESCALAVRHRAVPVVVRLMSPSKAWTGSLVAHTAGQSEANDFVEDFETYCHNNNYLKGLALDSNGDIMDVSECPDWDDVVLADGIKSKTQAHTLGFIEHLAEFREKGVRTSRGCLWVGPPGTGKTSVGRILARHSQQKATFLSIHAPTLGNCFDASRDVEEIFRMARSLQPTILLLDDLDRANSSVVNCLLGELDGTLNNDGLVIIATLNNPGKLDIALRDRPNRFDVIVGFDLPKEEEREKIFELLTGHLGLALDLPALASATDGLSPAHCTEIVRRAIIEDTCLKNGKSMETRISIATEEVMAQHRAMALLTEEEGEEQPTCGGTVRRKLL